MSRRVTIPISKQKGKLVASVGVFAGCYVLLLAFVFIMLVLNDFSGWKDYLVHEFSNVIFLLVSLFFLVCIIYFYYLFEDRAVLFKTSSILLLFTLIIVCSFICFLVGRYISPFMRPFALFSLLCFFLLSRRQALFMNFIFTFLLFVLDMYTNSYPRAELLEAAFATFIFCFVSGTFAVFFAGWAKTRGGLLLTGLFLAVPSCLVVALFLLPSLTSDWRGYLLSVGLRGVGSIVSASLALELLPLFEWTFNRLTTFRLRELTSPNAPLLVRLKTEAPGTFNHSLVVAQLSEACAVAIGENAELARAAAYYHDVGKLKQPECFTENQTGYNVHNELTPELSADIIRSHAKDGYALLVQSHLPKAIADVAREHHGTLPIKYFYDKAMRITGGDAKLEDYSYSGPIPQTKIAAIVMIADGAEAATRSLTDKTPENVEKTVRFIIEERMDLDQFAECDLTMRELTIIKQTIVDALSGIHHHRVKYPAIRFNRNREAVKGEQTDE